MLVQHSSNSNEWNTPEALFKELNEEFNFNLDPCSTDDNHKCKLYYTKKMMDFLKVGGIEKCFVILHIVEIN